MNEHEDLRKVIQAFEELTEESVKDDWSNDVLIDYFVPDILHDYFAELKNKLEIKHE